ncbi:erythrocyte membrane protein 1, PfEMP1, putative [Plasmodium gaboni]|uniref:Erythrocyte membrane protein 1, PfEMP1, putative n=1 Tax=Plasmodium gaboni TaxID=647221 RepID=A0ABY0KWI6_9APIC|nr:erythrocyte membrane protein 1, PfEMP1, putative [Plasmodium gaboni]
MKTNVCQKSTDKNIIDEKIEETDIYNKNMCGICPDDNKDNKGGGAHSCNDIRTTDLKGQCSTKHYDNIKAKTIDYEKDWTKATTKDNKTSDDVFVPPRRQQLCISYLAKNDINDEGKLKNMLIKTIKSETEKLYEYYKTGTPVTKNSDKPSNDPNNLPFGFCKAVERSFADIGKYS